MNETIPADDLALQLSTIISNAAVNADAPAAIVEDIQAHLGALYQTADESTQLAIANAWESVQALAINARDAQVFLSGASAIANAALEQRDQALGELEALADAVETIDTTHPTVNSLYVAIEDMVYEHAGEAVLDGIYANGGTVVGDPSVEVWESLRQIEGISPDELPPFAVCGYFFSQLMEASQLSLEEGRELIAFIKDFAPRVRARVLAEFEARRAEQNAELRKNWETAVS